MTLVLGMYEPLVQPDEPERDLLTLPALPLGLTLIVSATQGANAAATCAPTRGMLKVVDSDTQLDKVTLLLQPTSVRLAEGDALSVSSAFHRKLPAAQLEELGELATDTVSARLSELMLRSRGTQGRTKVAVTVAADDGMERVAGEEAASTLPVQLTNK